MDEDIVNCATWQEAEPILRKKGMGTAYLDNQKRIFEAALQEAAEIESAKELADSSQDQPKKSRWVIYAICVAILIAIVANI